MQRKLQQKIIPKSKSSKKEVKVKNLRFFGMKKHDKTSVEDIMKRLRNKRYI